MPATATSREAKSQSQQALLPLLQLRAQHAPGLFGFERLNNPHPRAQSLRDAATPVVFPEKLAHHLGRPQQLADRWLPVAVPDTLARAFGCDASMDAGRALLRRRLADLCGRLDAQLEYAPRVTQQGPCRLITVFRHVGFQVDYVSRRVSVARIDARGNAQTLDLEVELGVPLCTSYWLRWIIEELRLGVVTGQRPLFVTERQAAAHDNWLMETAYRLLRGDPRFVWLRREGLPHALGLDRTLSAFAVHARQARGAGKMPRSTYNLVWRHEQLFRQVARENPQLLKMLELFLREGRLPLKADPVAEMRDYFRAKGCSEAAWRYVHRHGDRLFSVACSMATNNGLLHVCLSYLRTLDAAGLPPPPPPTLARAWFRCYIPGGRDRLLFFTRWCAVHPTVIRVLLLTADARRRFPEFSAFVSEATGVLHWAMATGHVLTKSQARAGWRWLRRNWQGWYLATQRIEGMRYQGWGFPLPQTVIGRFEVLPLTNGAALIEEAYVMRNCLDLYASRCESGDVRLFSVRCAETGRRIATLGLGADWVEGGWHVLDIRRCANRPPTVELQRLAVEVVQRCNARCSVGRNAPDDKRR
ncbi:MAG: hypothetical protein Q8L65_11185 [Burkholderiales bacterium]|nr:hypothetical protein [Burkholderiales bacterium]MDP2399719.1 hypothetical protein [Burkholderiales bacterium]